MRNSLGDFCLHSERAWVTPGCPSPAGLLMDFDGLGEFWRFDIPFAMIDAAGCVKRSDLYDATNIEQ